VTLRNHLTTQGETQQPKMILKKITRECRYCAVPDLLSPNNESHATTYSTKSVTCIQYNISTQSRSAFIMQCRVSGNNTCNTVHINHNVMQHNINYTISLPYHHHHPLLSHSLYYIKSYMYIFIHYYLTVSITMPWQGFSHSVQSPNQTCTFTANSPKQTQAE
jgi:hypothetical protein